MVNKLLAPAVAISLAVSPMMSQAQDTQTRVAWVLCKMPQYCVDDSSEIISLDIIPAIPRSLMTSAQESVLRVEARCDWEDGYTRFFENEGIRNRVPEILWHVFTEWEWIPVSVIETTYATEDEMVCTVVRNFWE